VDRIGAGVANAPGVKTTLLTLFVAVGCGTSQPPPTFLASDASFLEPSVPQCVTEQPNPPGIYGCCQGLVFYADGEASKYSGQEGFPGHYELDGHVATGVLFGQDFEFDLSTNTATGAPLIAGSWIPDSTNLLPLACGW
jgi:hypothetical protein